MEEIIAITLTTFFLVGHFFCTYFLLLFNFFLRRKINKFKKNKLIYTIFEIVLAIWFLNIILIIVTPSYIYFKVLYPVFLFDLHREIIISIAFYGVSLSVFFAVRILEKNPIN